MPRLLIITAHRPGRSPSQRFRFEQYIDFLTENGWECETSYLISEEDDATFYAPKNYSAKYRIWRASVKRRALDAARAKDFDVVMIHREALMTGSIKYEKIMKESGAKIVYDFDDSIWLSNVSGANKNLEWLKDYKKTSALIGIADLVIAGNQYLSDYARQYNENVVIIPTTIDTEEYVPAQLASSDRICIGWSGSRTTIQHFEFALPFITKLVAKYGDKVEFKVIGDHYDDPALHISGKPWEYATEIADLSRFHIGIMPLPDDEWAKGKCGLKGLQYMALGIPTIMSPVGVNSEIITNRENGMLASTEDEWVDALSVLIDDAELRRRLGDAGRRTVIDRYSVESQKHRYLDYLVGLLNG